MHLKSSPVQHSRTDAAIEALNVELCTDMCGAIVPSVSVVRTRAVRRQVVTDVTGAVTRASVIRARVGYKARHAVATAKNCRPSGVDTLVTSFGFA